MRDFRSIIKRPVKTKTDIGDNPTDEHPLSNKTSPRVDYCIRKPTRVKPKYAKPKTSSKKDSTSSDNSIPDIRPYSSSNSDAFPPKRNETNLLRNTLLSNLNPNDRPKITKQTKRRTRPKVFIINLFEPQFFILFVIIFSEIPPSFS